MFSKIDFQPCQFGQPKGDKNEKPTEFVRKIKRLGRRRGVRVRLESKRGKGSHATLYYGGARTVMQDLKRELPTGTLHAMLEQLDLTVTDLE